MSKRRNSKRNRPVKTLAPRQLEHLVVIRESAHDLLLMEGLLAQTVSKLGDLPGANEVLQAGAENLYRDPKRYGATEHRQGTSRMVMVERDGVLYLLSMGSAAKKDDETGSNAFVSYLIDIIKKYRPREVWAANFTRLIRSAVQAGELFEVLQESVECLHCETDIRPSTPEGLMIFQFLTVIASTERNYIVQRHTAGRIAQWRRGHWIVNAWPPGYRIDDGVLVLDEREIPKVRQMLRILADLSLTKRECAVRIGALGITTPKIQQIYGEGGTVATTVADARNPSEVINTLTGWVGAYEHGINEVLWENPFPGVEEVVGCTVEEHPDYAYGCLRFPQDVPLPDGGWGTDDVFARIRERAVQPIVTGGASHRKTTPLAGMFRYRDDDQEYALRAGDGVYRLETRPFDPARSHRGWRAEDPLKQLVCSVPREVFHRSLATTVAGAIATGVPAELDHGRYQADGALPVLDGSAVRLRSLRSQLKDLEARRTKARRNANLAEDEEALHFIQEASELSKDCRRLAGEIEELEGARVEPTLGLTFASTADLAAHALAALSSAGPSGTATLRESLRTIISGERLSVTGRQMTWELYIDLPHPEGTVRLGPISGTVPVRLPSRPSEPERNELMCTLRDLGLSEVALLAVRACPSLELGRVLAHYLEGAQLPVGVDPTWAEHVIGVYTAPTMKWNRGRWRLNDDLRRSAIDVVRAAGGEASLAEFEAAGVGAKQVRYLARVTNAPSGDPILVRSGRQRWRLLGCPHCGGTADHSIVTPETAPGVLCSTCWKLPLPGSPTFPEWYRSQLATA